MLRIRSNLLLIGLAYLAFVSLGLPDGLLGVAWPSIRASFDLPLDALGSLLVMFTIGYLLSSFNSGRVLAHINVGMLLALSCLATSASLLGYALAPGWATMVALALIAGLGAGAIDAGLNTFAATHFSSRMVSWLHATYGLGATIGPLIMTSVLMAERPWRWGYAIVGGWQLLLAAIFGLTSRKWPNATMAKERSVSVSPAPTARTLRLPVVWLSLAVFFVYTGLEAAAGAWSYTLFTEGRGIPMNSAGMWISIYWGSFTGGRVFYGFAAGLVPVQRVLRFCAIGIALGAALIWLNMTPMLSFLGLALMGLSAAPVFPLLIATTPERLGKSHTANAIGFQIAAAVLGQSLLPGLIGVLATYLGLEIVGPALLVMAILLLGLYESMASLSPQKLSLPAGKHTLGKCQYELMNR